MTGRDLTVVTVISISGLLKKRGSTRKKVSSIFVAVAEESSTEVLGFKVADLQRAITG
jgi:hypothetical protein